MLGTQRNCTGVTSNTDNTTVVINVQMNSTANYFAGMNLLLSNNFYRSNSSAVDYTNNPLLPSYV